MRHHPLHRLARLSILMTLPLACSACVHGDIKMTVAPHLGQTSECVPYEPLPADAAAWLRSNPVPPPAGWKHWKDDFLIGKVRPKLQKDCE